MTERVTKFMPLISDMGFVITQLTASYHWAQLPTTSKRGRFGFLQRKEPRQKPIIPGMIFGALRKGTPKVSDKTYVANIARAARFAGFEPYEDSEQDPGTMLVQTYEVKYSEAMTCFLLKRPLRPREPAWQAVEYVKIWKILLDPNVGADSIEFYVTASETIELTAELWEDIMWICIQDPVHPVTRQTHEKACTYAYLNGVFYRLPTFGLQHFRHYLSPSPSQAGILEIISRLGPVSW